MPSLLEKKCPRMHWLLKHYDVLSVQGLEKLIVPLSNETLDVIYYVHDDELFNILQDIHTSTEAIISVTTEEDLEKVVASVRTNSIQTEMSQPEEQITTENDQSKNNENYNQAITSVLQSEQLEMIEDIQSGNEEEYGQEVLSVDQRNRNITDARKSAYD
ncbi:hypothetical protein ILUMI_15007 [Ignelater luminosus]|uniref:Uncharacterized protein n=1 Tax=Ignelater luminosus TaxID=2038154 RepID=A0A8K0G9Y5_IGNLU|nr:hypothetical protein ILUMI_15007 [Ignelater luminosus]